MADSPVSSLSSLSSDDLQDDMATPHQSSRPRLEVYTTPLDGDLLAPPSKRRKTGASAVSTGVFNVHDRAIGYQSFDEDDESMSEDTQGSAPGSPSHDEFALKAEHVTACQWENCDAGDFGNSDDLVKHVQDEHVVPKRAKYTCDWGDCARKGTVHPSGYALKAHMRSHTKEKPYFCALPECDRSFTRSDALAKHLRTVHEPEAPKSITSGATPADAAAKKGAKLRLSKNAGINASSPVNPSAITEPSQNPHNAGLDPSHPDYDSSAPNDNIQYIPAHHPITGQPGFMITYPPDIHFTQFESEIPANQLMRLLRRQLHWAQQDSEALQAAVDDLEHAKAKEWIKKEMVLEEAMRAELDRGVARRLLTEPGLADKMSADIVPIAQELEHSTGKLEINPKRLTAKVKTEPASFASGGVRGEAEVDEPDHPAKGVKFQEKEQQQQQQQQQREDDMMAVGALMGLSGR